MKVMLAGCVAVLAGFAAAQCPVEASSPEFAFGPGPEGPISKVLAFDPDGAGPMQDDLMVIGDFSRVAGVAGYRGIARFDGAAWSPVPGITATSPVYIRNGETIFVTSAAPMTSDGRNIGFAARFIPSINDWEPLDLNGAITTVQPYGEGFLIGGNFTQAGGQSIEDYALLIDGEWSQPPRVAGTEKLLALSEGRFVAYNINGTWVTGTIWFYDDGAWSTIANAPYDGGVLYAYQGELYFIYSYYLQGVLYTDTNRFNGTAWVTSPRLPVVPGTDEQYQFRRYEEYYPLEVRRAVDPYNSAPLCLISQDENNGGDITFIDYRGVLLAKSTGGFINSASVGNLGTIDPLSGCVAAPLTQGLNLSPKAKFVSSENTSAPLTLYEGRFENSTATLTENFISWDGQAWSAVRSRNPLDGWGDSAVYAYIGETLYVTHRYAGTNVLSRFEGEQLVDAFVLPANFYTIQLVTQSQNKYLVATANSTNARVWRLESAGTNGAPDVWIPEFAPLPAPDARLAILPTSSGDRAYSYHNTTTATLISRWNGSAWVLAHTLPRLTTARATVHDGDVLIIAGETGGSPRTPTLYQIDQSQTLTQLPSLPNSPPRLYKGFSVTSAADFLFVVASAGTPVTDTVWVQRGSGWLPVSTLAPRSSGLPPAARAFEDGLLLYSDTDTLPNGEPTFRFVYIPAPVVCIADQNCDGGVDGSDIETFFIMFEAGDPSADVNNDGGVDGSDVQVFFEVWESGELGCG